MKQLLHSQGEKEAEAQHAQSGYSASTEGLDGGILPSPPHSHVLIPGPATQLCQSGGSPRDEAWSEEKVGQEV